jgi:uncharacterized protein (DUF58 family)
MLAFIQNIRLFIRNTGFSFWFYLALFLLSLLYIIGFIFPRVATVAHGATWFFVLVAVSDLILLNYRKHSLKITRSLPQRFSNGDDNIVPICCQSLFPFTIRVHLIDEIPVQFQYRDMSFYIMISAGGSHQLSYSVKPLHRGNYEFGRTLAYVYSPVRLLSRRFVVENETTIPVYPGFIQMQKYQMMVISNRLVDAGIKPIRKVGHHSEFDQIRHYISGDDYRLINWKATARKAEPMVNQFIEEKSQPVYSLIDMGRNMQSPFHGMTLLDYAINTSLIISNIALLKSDKAGLVTFSKNIDSLLPATNQAIQMNRIMELLYKAQTRFDEPNYELLYGTLCRKITQRSLLLLFTNFESPVSLQKQLKYLAGLAKDHLLLVIFFKNTELYRLTHLEPKNTREVYIQTIAEKLIFDKTLIEKELHRYGILTLLTEPQNLTPQIINEYLKVKARGML